MDHAGRTLRSPARRHPSPLLLVLAAAVACHDGPRTPEARVRAVIERAQQAVAEKDLGILTELVSKRYEDASGRDRDAIVTMLRRQFVEFQSIHLLTRVQSLELPEPKRAEARVLVAAGATPLSEEDLASMRADLYRFELTLANEDPGGWRVVRAAWRRVGAGGLM